jgi:hypothetical protein
MHGHASIKVGTCLRNISFTSPKISNISCHQFENLTSTNFALKERCILYFILFLCVKRFSEE